MNKIININLGGIAFTLDEDAYERLKRYLDSLRRHFSGSPSCDEIVGDIEFRLGEILEQKLLGRSIVNINDIESALAVMGTPADFEAEEPAPAGKATEKKSTRSKRLYRNPDDVVVGGVCSGMAAYFGVEEVLWFRIGFAILAVSSFGMAALVYLVLMASVPKAETYAEKLEMRGEPVNVDNIARTIEESATNFANSLGKSAQSLSSRGKGKMGDFFQELASRVGPVFAAGVKIFVLFIIGSILLSLIVAWFSVVVAFAASFRDLNNFFFINSSMAWITLVCSLLTIGMPIVTLILAILRLTTSYRANVAVRLTISGIWLLSVAGLAYVGISHGMQFRDLAEIKTEQALTPPTGTLYVKMGDDSNSFRGWVYNNIKVDETGMTIPDVHLYIRKADSSNLTLKEVRHTWGNSRSQAENFANGIQYKYSQNGNSLELTPNLTVPAGYKYRGQEVELTLNLPVGTRIILDRSAARRLRDADTPNDDLWVHRIAGERLIMTEKGLKREN